MTYVAIREPKNMQSEPKKAHIRSLPVVQAGARIFVLSVSCRSVRQA